MIPANKINGLTFYPVPEFTQQDAAFGAPKGAFFDRYNVPEVPRKYTELAMGLFFKGGMVPEFKPHVDRALAIKATKAWLSSWDCPHESKEATVGYAFWCWIEGEP